jgi:cytochrome P450
MTSYTILISYSSLVLLWYVLLWIAYTRLLHPLKHIPGPFWASVTRLWRVHHVRKGDMDVVQRALHSEHGPLVRIGPDEVSCADPDAVRKIYSTSRPLRKASFYTIWHNKTFSKYPDNSSNTDEKLHAERRKIVNNVYSMTTVLSLEPYIDACSALFVKRMGEAADSHTVVDLGGWLQ